MLFNELIEGVISMLSIMFEGPTEQGHQSVQYLVQLMWFFLRLGINVVFDQGYD